MINKITKCGIALLALGTNLCAQAKSTPPNIVFILADDLGWTGLGCYGSKYYETPNIDKIARQGMKFTQGYACATVSAPSRAALMSGQYSSRNGTLRVTDVQRKKGNLNDYIAIQPKNRPFSENIITMAEALKDAGYATAMFGKWHISPGNPGVHGFDKWITSHKRHFKFKTEPKYEVNDSVYLSDFMADKAIDFIDENKNRPFFLYLPDYLVHKPHQAKQRLIDKYKKKSPVGGHHDPGYAAMTESLDETVGRIYDTLEKNGLLENTLFIFTSDNGAPARTSFGEKRMKRNFTNNLPLRDGKGLMYEGGLRVPYIFMWKGKIKPNTICHEPIIGLDLYPTFLSAAGLDLPNQQLDGIDILPLLTNKVQKLEDRAFFWYYPNYGPAKRKKNKINYSYIPTDVVRYGNYVMLEFYHHDTEHLELYDLSNDISEENNLVDSNPQITNKLYKMLKEWQKKVHAVRPKINHSYQP